jgi:hypothetical protein
MNYDFIIEELQKLLLYLRIERERYARGGCPVNVDETDYQTDLLRMHSREDTVHTAILMAEENKKFHEAAWSN